MFHPFAAVKACHEPSDRMRPPRWPASVARGCVRMVSCALCAACVWCGQCSLCVVRSGDRDHAAVTEQRTRRHRTRNTAHTHQPHSAMRNNRMDATNHAVRLTTVAVGGQTDAGRSRRSTRHSTPVRAPLVAMSRALRSTVAVAVLLLCHVAWTHAAAIACDTANQLVAVRHAHSTQRQIQQRSRVSERHSNPTQHTQTFEITITIHLGRPCVDGTAHSNAHWPRPCPFACSLLALCSCFRNPLQCTTLPLSPLC